MYLDAFHISKVTKQSKNYFVKFFNPKKSAFNQSFIQLMTFISWHVPLRKPVILRSIFHIVIKNDKNEDNTHKELQLHVVSYRCPVLVYWLPGNDTLHYLSVLTL